MKIAFYCPNKPLSHPRPSGDLIIAQGIHRALNEFGHDCRELVQFRSRWFWKRADGWRNATIRFVFALQAAVRFRPAVWLTYHSYYKSPDLIGPWITRILKIPYILFQPMYGTRRRKDSGTRIGFYLNRLALKNATHAFTNNVSDLEALRRILPREKITYVPPGIFPEDFMRNESAGREIRRQYHLATNIPLLMTAAMFRADVKFESLFYLFRSLSHRPRKNADFRLLVVGGGPMQEELQKVAEELLPRRVIFAGPVPRPQMADYYSAADLFVFPGIGESLGMVFLEAQACGCPVIALRTSGTSQVVVHGETGLLVEKDDGRRMAEAIETLLQNRELHARFAQNGPHYIMQKRNLRSNYLLLSKKLEEIVEP